MKKTVVFAGFMGLLLAATGVARGDTPTPYFAPDTPANYPGFTEQSQTIGSGANAQTYAAGTIKDDFIKLATTKYVDARVDDANNSVVTLNGNANTANTNVTTNETDITAMQSNRQVIPGSDSCANANDVGENQNYAACGYISDGTADANGYPGSNASAHYAWVKIAGGPCASSETCLSVN